MIRKEDYQKAKEAFDKAYEDLVAGKITKEEYNLIYLKLDTMQDEYTAQLEELNRTQEYKLGLKMTKTTTITKH